MVTDAVDEVVGGQDVHMGDQATEMDMGVGEEGVNTGEDVVDREEGY